MTARDLRLAFVGQSLYFDYCSMKEPGGGVTPAFVDFRADAPPAPMLAALRAFEPDVVFVWRPEIVPAGAFAELDAITVGYLTEPLPRPNGVAHRDLDTRLWTLRQADPSNFDRIVSFDPLIAPSADQVLPVWRSFPIPVTDRYFAPVRPAEGPPRILFHGRSTPHREQWLMGVKHDFDVVHLAHGISGERLVDFMAAADVGINLHNEPYPTFENRISVYLAAGLLVVSEPVSPRHGLEPGVDYLETGSGNDIWELMARVAQTPDAFRAVRLSGRRAAERFRASRVFPRFVRDLIADVDAFGSARANGARASASATLARR